MSEGTKRDEVATSTTRSIVGALATTVLIVACQPPYALWWIGPFALVPWLALARSTQALVVTGLLWGTLSGIGMGHWIATGLHNVGATRVQGALGLLLCAFVITGLPAALYGVAAAFARRCGSASWLAFGVGVFAVDALRGVEWFLPWSLLGHSQSPASGVAQLALVGGVPLVSGLLAAIAFALAEALRRRPGGRAAASLVGAYLALLLLGVPVAESLRDSSAGSSQTLLLLQPRLTPGDRWISTQQRTNVVLLSRRTLEALRSAEVEPDLIVWPETSITVDPARHPELEAELRTWLARFETPLVLGAVSAENDPSRYRNTVLWLDASGGVVDRFDKTRAVPLVEREPSGGIERFLRKLMGASAVERLVREGSEQRPIRGDRAYAVALCFEILYPRLVSARVDEDVLAILNLANDAWYGSPVPGLQQLAFSTFRAIEHRRSLVRVADSGPSAFVDPFGRVTHRLGADEVATLHATVAASRPPGGLERSAITALGLGGAVLGGLVGRSARRTRRAQDPAAG